MIQDPDSLLCALANIGVGQRAFGGEKYLIHEKLEKQHGADQEDLDKIEHFAQEYDLMVVHRSAAERSVVLTGELGDCWRRFTLMCRSTTTLAERIAAEGAKSPCRKS